MGNNIKTVVLLAVLTAFIVWVGQILGGTTGMVIALILAAAMNFFSYWFSDKIVLRMYKAKEVSSNEVPLVYEIVKKLTVRAGLPMPKVFLIPEESPNAFATGRDPEHAVVAVTVGLVHLMNKEELEGVIAHELAHIKNRDILISSIAATLAGAVMMLANMARFAAFFGGRRSDDSNNGGGIIGLILMSVIAPVAAMIIQMAISRSREFLADSTGAGFAGNSKGLSEALAKLGSYSKNLPMTANPSTAHMFIVNPLSGKSLIYLFSTHPPLEERIQRLGGISPQKTSNGSMPDKGEEEAKAFWKNLS
ncbi:MAG: zinc metalloprotease HtpX [Desulfobacterium sp.]|nr:zinc metalloprotease HtpX [Desulfobacterium sp.]MBU3949710.1 zinc metalloprotease HtpX [Pseudomonadota bacterium]MBU4037914.1 zinc metalloprotease HtpX [Pseudomonadota bacterium]